MWLLKFHCAVSILCLLAIFGFYWICQKSIRKNGWGRREEVVGFKRFLFFVRGCLYFALVSFIPMFNVITPWIILYMASHENPEQEDT